MHIQDEERARDRQTLPDTHREENAERREEGKQGGERGGEF